MPLIFRRYFYTIIQSYSIPFSAQMLAIAINFTFWFSGFLGENMPWTHISHSTAHDFFFIVFVELFSWFFFFYLRLHSESHIEKRASHLYSEIRYNSVFNWSQMNGLLKQLFTNYVCYSINAIMRINFCHRYCFGFGFHSSCLVWCFSWHHFIHLSTSYDLNELISFPFIEIE